MITLSGRPVFGGIAKGVLVFYHRDEIVVNKLKVNDPEREYNRYVFAKNAAARELKALYEKSVGEVGEGNALIFSIHEMIINDSQFEQLVKDYILTKKYNADYAVVRTAQTFTNLLAQMDSDYIKERRSDVKDVSVRLLRHLQNRSNKEIKLKSPSIICSDELMPSEMINLDKNNTAAVCTSGGSTNSHTSILSKTMNIPALIGMGDALNEEFEGKPAIVDGYSGTLYIEPDESTVRMIEQKTNDEGRKRELLVRLKGRRNITRDGKEFPVYANTGTLADVETAIENDAGGIGLFRSDYMYAGREKLPDEETLFYNYRRVLEDMKGKRVVIRTLDIGVESDPDFFGFEREPNPSLGLRSIRLCLLRKDIFRTQLRALYRASVYGNLSILIPMIIQLSEIYEVKSIIDSVKDELIRERVPISCDVDLGVTIETPASVMISDLLIKEVDFFTIGTNDLEQYTYAIDRSHPYYEKYLPPNHFALLRMIKIVCDNAHAAGKKVTVCGELAANPKFTEIFLDMHVDALSVAPPNVLTTRKTIRSLNLSDRRQIHSNIQKALGYL
jgi:phosphotransferase system enzyme I (PtsI)